MCPFCVHYYLYAFAMRSLCFRSTISMLSHRESIEIVLRSCVHAPSGTKKPPFHRHHIDEWRLGGDIPPYYLTIPFSLYMCMCYILVLDFVTAKTLCFYFLSLKIPDAKSLRKSTRVLENMISDGHYRSGTKNKTNTWVLRHCHAVRR